MQLDPQHYIPLRFPRGVRFGLFPFRSRYLGNPNWFLFLPLLRSFSSGSSRSLWNAEESRRSPLREVSLRHPRIYACVQLPEAFRCLPRPSSALKPSHPPDGVACRAYSVILQCLFSIGYTYFLAIWLVFGYHCEQIKAHSTLCS